MVHLDCYGTIIIIIYGHLYGYGFCCGHMHGHPSLCMCACIRHYGYGNSCDHIHDQLWGLYLHLGILMYVYMYVSLCSYGHDHGYGNSLHHKYGYVWGWNLLLCMAYICLFFHPHPHLCLWLWLWQFLMMNMGGVTFSYMHLFLLLCMTYECNCMYQGIGNNSKLLSMSALWMVMTNLVNTLAWVNWILFWRLHLLIYNVYCVDHHYTQWPSFWSWLWNSCNHIHRNVWGWKSFLEIHLPLFIMNWILLT